MTSQIPCPNCGQPADAQARLCSHCGVDLAIAAVMAEREITLARLPAGMAVTPEILVPRLGEYLVEKGHLKSADLERTLAYQQCKAAEGEPLLLGQALRELHLIKPEVLDHAITEQILQLQDALKRSNLELESRVRERTSELEKAIEKLGELNQLKANFIANVSHELRTPLTHIKGYLDILADAQLGPLAQAQSDALGVMRRAERRLEDLIEDLIQFALVSRGELSIDLAPVDIAMVLRILVDQGNRKARPTGITVDLKLEEGLPQVLCDAEKIAWVITQLMDNAVKFTSKGGLVKVEAFQDDKFVKIAVIDSGIGIPAERIAEIFEPFHQLDSSSTRRYGGTGMGLALSQRIIKAHNSTLQVESRVGEGTCIEFSLPIVENGV